MYEHLRNNFMCAVIENGISQEELDIVLQALDKVSTEFEIKRRETALIPYGEELPEIVKVYVVCKKIEGLADTTLETYTRVLGIFLPRCAQTGRNGHSERYPSLPLSISERARMLKQIVGQISRLSLLVLHLGNR